MNTIAASNAKPAIRAKMYKSVDAINHPSHNTLDAASVVVNRGQNFSQVWFMYYDSTLKGDGFDVTMTLRDLVSDYQNLKTDDEGKAKHYVLAINDSVYSPYVNADIWDTATGNNINTTNNLCSIHSAFYSLIQKLPFAINPFDAKAKYTFIDPFSLAYMFGLCGFYAADYSEMEYNRINAVQQQAYGFTEDPYSGKSPLFR